MKKATIILLSLLLIGCTTQRKVLDSWMGLKKSDLILAWGPPDRTAEDGNGGEVLIYGHHVYAPEMNWNFWDYKMMYVNGDGKIYHWRTSRQQVAPTEVVVSFR